MGLSRWKVTLTLLPVTCVIAEPLTTIKPCPDSPLEVSDITVTAQYQTVSTCSPITTCRQDACTTSYPFKTFQYVDTVIPCGWDGKTASSVRVTNLDQAITVSREAKPTIISQHGRRGLNEEALEERGWINRYKGGLGSFGRLKHGGSGWGGWLPAPMAPAATTTMYKDYVVPFRNCGPLAIPGYEGNGLPHNNGPQVVTVTDCAWRWGYSHCIEYIETWTPAQGPTSTQGTTVYISTKTVVPDQGTYTITVQQTIPAQTLTSGSDSWTVPEQPWYWHTTKTCHPDQGSGWNTIDVTVTVTTTITVTVPCATIPGTTSRTFTVTATATSTVTSCDSCTATANPTLSVPSSTSSASNAIVDGLFTTLNLPYTGTDSIASPITSTLALPIGNVAGTVAVYNPSTNTLSSTSSLTSGLLLTSSAQPDSTNPQLSVTGSPLPAQCTPMTTTIVVRQKRDLIEPIFLTLPTSEDSVATIPGNVGLVIVSTPTISFAYETDSVTPSNTVPAIVTIYPVPDASGTDPVTPSNTVPAIVTFYPVPDASGTDPVTPSSTVPAIITFYPVPDASGTGSTTDSVDTQSPAISTITDTPISFITTIPFVFGTDSETSSFILSATAIGTVETLSLPFGTESVTTQTLSASSDTDTPISFITTIPFPFTTGSSQPSSGVDTQAPASSTITGTPLLQTTSTPTNSEDISTTTNIFSILPYETIIITGISTTYTYFSVPNWVLPDQSTSSPTPPTSSPTPDTQASTTLTVSTNSITTTVSTIPAPTTADTDNPSTTSYSILPFETVTVTGLSTTYTYFSVPNWVLPGQTTVTAVVYGSGCPTVGTFMAALPSGLTTMTTAATTTSAGSVGFQAPVSALTRGTESVSGFVVPTTASS